MIIDTDEYDDKLTPICAYNVSEIVLSILHELAYLNLITIL